MRSGIRQLWGVQSKDELSAEIVRNSFQLP